jgi:hypothetical protein
MKKRLLNGLIIFTVTILLLCCSTNKKNPDMNTQKPNLGYDPELKEPDGYGGGYVLTALGRLIYGPWQLSQKRYFISLYFDEKEISSKGYDILDSSKNLVFELQRDHTVHFWYKQEYEKRMEPVDSAWKEQGVEYATHFRPGIDVIKKIRKTGRWEASFKDSSLVIHFGDINVADFTGYYSQLGSGLMALQKVSYYDSTINGKIEKIKKIITIQYEHPWNNEPFRK